MVAHQEGVFYQILPLDHTKDIASIRRDSWMADIDFTVRRYGLDNDAVKPLFAAIPFGFLAEVQKGLRTPTFANEDAAYTEWWSQTQHRLLIRIRIMGLHLANPSEATRAYWNFSERTLLEWLENEATPEEAREGAREAVLLLTTEVGSQ